MPYAPRMGNPQAIPVPLDDETLADLDWLAGHLGESRERLLVAAVLRFVNDELHASGRDAPEGGWPNHVPEEPTALALHEAEGNYLDALDTFIKEGEDDIVRGDFVSHEDFMAELKARYGQKRAA